MSRLTKFALLCAMVTIVAVSLLTFSATGEPQGSSGLGAVAEATNTIPFPPGPSATPVGKAFAPIVFDMVSVATATPSPTSTPEVEPTYTLPATPP